VRLDEHAAVVPQLLVNRRRRSGGLMLNTLVDKNVVAEKLNVSTSTVKRMTLAGELPHVKIGRSVRYDLHAIAEWLDSKKAKAA
jgi:excisionase family DNA binding protein